MASTLVAPLSSLLNSSTLDDHEESLKQANAAIKKNKTNQDAQHRRVVALLKLDRFEDALDALKEGGEGLAARCVLENAYALYKTGRLEEAAAVVRGQSSDLPGIKHIAAQVAYRAERFEDAAGIYKDLSSRQGDYDGEENDLRINVWATEVQQDWQEGVRGKRTMKRKPGREDLETFETVFNVACGYIAAGELTAGNLLLKRARDLCEAFDELTDEEKRAEVLPIMVQQIYVLTRLGKLEEAEQLQKHIEVAGVPEAPTRLIASSNSFPIAVKQGNPYLAQKYFDSLPELTKTERLFEYQDRILRSNRYAVDLAAMKYDGVARSTARILTQTPGPSVSPWNSSVSAIHAAASARCGTDAASLKQLTQLLEKRPDDVGLLLTVVQLHLRNDNVSAAISLLEAFSKRLEEVGSYDEIRFAPGLVALAVQLYRSQGRKAAVGDLLERAAKFWHQKPDAAAGLLKAAGLALLESSDPEGLSMARDIFGDLQQQDSNKPLISAGLVAATSTVDLASARPFLEALTPVNELISGVDVASLEGAGVASLPASLPPAGTKRSAPSDSEKAVKKKIRKSKMPKDYEEGKKMDPERWLPLRDRSSYRPKGKKGKKKALETTQGGVVREEESLELEGGAGAVKVEKAPTGPGKAKKKKGKK